MVEIKITVKSVETTDEGTLVIEMSPYPYARWIQTEALAVANVAVQPYGVIMVPEAATFTPGGLTVDVEVKGYIFSVPLSTLMEADAEDQIEFISPYITVADLADVDLTNLQNGQTLIWDATNNVWVNGAGGGGGESGYTVEKVTYIPLQTVALTRQDEYTLVGTLSSGDFPSEDGEYYLEIDGVEDTVNYVYDAEYNCIYDGDYTLTKTSNTITIEYDTTDDVASIELTLYGKVITLSADFENAVKQVSQPTILYFDPSNITDNMAVLYRNAECTIFADPLDVADKFNVRFVMKPTEGQPISYFIPTNIVDNGADYSYSVVVEMSQNTFVTLSFGFTNL